MDSLLGGEENNPSESVLSTEMLPLCSFLESNFR